ncbi:MAG: type II toxin-antitoxin system HicB family antitoxin [Planctomycetes bacterium]|nr:type II toxin-antitoxin system HicB family antitoxin [Planctomycetota bacterium]
MKPFEYKGYVGTIDYSDDDEVMHGKVINISGLVTYEASNIKQLKKEFVKSVESYLKFCKENGKEAQKPMTGRLTVRLDPQLHLEAVSAAMENHVSLNEFISKAVNNAVHVS